MRKNRWDAEQYNKKTWSNRLNYLKSTVKVCRTTLLKPRFRETEKQNEMTGYAWYCQLVNDAIKEIRAGRNYYIYKEEHIMELVKYFGDFLKAELYGDYWVCSISPEAVKALEKKSASKTA